jgi:ankyrin repeat protein
VSEVDEDENGKTWAIDTPNKEGKTPLMRVVEKCNYELIEVLIRDGANLQITDDDGDSISLRCAFVPRPLEWPNQETAPEIFKVNIDQQRSMSYL